jgi:metallo-beta-lactamase class B
MRTLWIILGAKDSKRSSRFPEWCCDLSHFQKHFIMKKFVSYTIFIFVLLGCSPKKTALRYESDQLVVEQLTEHSFRHITYLNTQDFGKVACNGMIVVDQGEAIIFDTPNTDVESEELIQWVEEELGSTVKGIVATHFHTDCLGGLQAFHKRNIPSYATEKTIELATAKGHPIPQNGFMGTKELTLGDKKVILDYVGEGHTQDNCIGYFPSEEVLFGGCLIKSLGAGKGNLEDANTEAWPHTVQDLKSKYPKAGIIIPGHGKPGNAELLDFTMALFTD